MLSKENNSFYVYVHRKITDNSIFYVGKGSKKRLDEKTNRNKHWKNVVNKHGFKSEKIADNLNEELSFLVEVEKIEQLKILGYKLVNKTKGGEGLSGYTHTQETKDKISKKSSLLKHTEETKKKLAEIFKGKALPKEALEKASKTNKSRIYSAEFRQKISEVHKNKVVSNETREKMSSWQVGKKHSDEVKRKISDSMKAYRASKTNLQN